MLTYADIFLVSGTKYVLSWYKRTNTEAAQFRAGEAGARVREETQKRRR